MKYSLILSLLLSACSATIQGGSEIVPVKWHKARDQGEVFAICSKVYPGMPKDVYFRVVGCFWYDKDVCNVVSIDSPRRLDTLGHEVKHCFDGYFHSRGVINTDKFLVKE